MVLAGTERFIIELIRTNRQYVLGLTGAQLIGALMALLGLALLYYLPRRETAAETG